MLFAVVNLFIMGLVVRWFLESTLFIFVVIKFDSLFLFLFLIENVEDCDIAGTGQSLDHRDNDDDRECQNGNEKRYDFVVSLLELKIKIEIR